MVVSYTRRALLFRYSVFRCRAGNTECESEESDDDEER